MQGRLKVDSVERALKRSRARGRKADLVRGDIYIVILHPGPMCMRPTVLVV